MTLDGNISIFRFTTDGQTETALAEGEKVEFDTSISNGVSVTPDALSHIDKRKIIMEKIHTEQPIPGSNDPINIQDTGLGIVTITFTGYFDEKVGIAKGVDDLANWMVQANQSPALSKGRFGLRMDDRPEFDAVPDGTAPNARGYNLITFELGEIDEDFPAHIPFILVLQYNGDITKLGI